jgi:tRNA-2-methylthio-N6-dimethylallyladenosine synthase
MRIIDEYPMRNKNLPKYHIETYGCQMNISDSEIVSSILSDYGFSAADNADSADIILLNTCSVRDNAEKKIFEKLTHLKQYKKKNNNLVIGILGCMAERLRSDLLGAKDLVNLVVGPDEYRKIPELLNDAIEGNNGIAVQLSRVETYDDIKPLRTHGISAWVSIMRGCNNFCTYCIVPYTRGRERSRPAESIIREINDLWESGFREVTFLGQNVNSYFDEVAAIDFSDLLAMAAKSLPGMRFRFTTSHPKDLSDKLIETIAANENICRHIHLAMQSGSDRVLKIMNRNYTIDHFIGRVAKIRELVPDASLSTDIIAGFPGETIEDHQATLRALLKIKFDGAFMFRYSPREGTKAYEYLDDVPEDEKLRRLNQIIELQNSISKDKNEKEIGNTHEVLVEGPSKKNQLQWRGRSDTNKVVIFDNHNGNITVGQTVKVRINGFTSATLFGCINNCC